MEAKPGFRHFIHAVGFSTYEKSIIESFFRIASQRPPGWTVTDDWANAIVILLSASSRDVIDEYIQKIEPWQKVIVVGGSDFGTGWPFLPRPIKLTAILAKLGEVDGKADTTMPSGPVTKPVPKAVPPAAISPVTPIVTLDRPKGVATSERPVDAAAAINKPNPAVLGRVLVVDDSDVALRFMQNRLRHFGYETDVVRCGEEALTMVASHDFQFVFLDVMMTGLDGYQTCRAIKQNKARKGAAPIVVMLTSRGGTIDKIRGSMAGCDAYLTKPLNEKQLAVVLAKHDKKPGPQGGLAGSAPQERVDPIKTGSI